MGRQFGTHESVRAAACFGLNAPSTVPMRSTLRKLELRAMATPIPKNHHLDKHAARLIATTTGAADDLLTPEQVADWLSVGLEWLDQARARGYGPRPTKFSRKHVRYKRGDVLRWLRDRTNHF